jgi:hypothetical protein
VILLEWPPQEELLVEVVVAVFPREADIELPLRIALCFGGIEQGSP